jgi:hypothetical protein
VFVLGKPVLFEGKARSLLIWELLTGAPLEWALASLTLDRLERLSRDKRSSLLGTLINYDLKKFYNIVPRFK